MKLVLPRALPDNLEKVSSAQRINNIVSQNVHLRFICKVAFSVLIICNGFRVIFVSTKLLLF